MDSLSLAVVEILPQILEQDGTFDRKMLLCYKEGILSMAGSKSKHPGSAIGCALSNLRDLGFVQFLGEGKYKWCSGMIGNSRSPAVDANVNPTLPGNIYLMHSDAMFPDVYKICVTYMPLNQMLSYHPDAEFYLIYSVEDLHTSTKKLFAALDSYRVTPVSEFIRGEITALAAVVRTALSTDRLLQAYRWGV